MFILSRVWLILILFLPLGVQAAVGEPYSRARLDALNQAGQPVLVAVHADWCGTCRVQDRVLGDLLGSNKYTAIKVLRVDYDQQRAAVQSFGVRYQSTLIVFKSGKEVARSVAETDPALIAELLNRAL